MQKKIQTLAMFALIFGINFSGHASNEEYSEVSSDSLNNNIANPYTSTFSECAGEYYLGNGLKIIEFNVYNQNKQDDTSSQSEKRRIICDDNTDYSLVEQIANSQFGNKYQVFFPIEKA